MSTNQKEKEVEGKGNSSSSNVHTPARERGKTLTIQTSPSEPWGSLFTEKGTPKNVGCVDLQWDERQGKSVKRKKGDGGSDTQDTWKEDAGKSKKLATKIRTIIEVLNKETKDLSKLSKENVTTKREIKESIGKLRSLASQLMTNDMQEIIQSMERHHKDTNIDVTQTTPVKISRRIQTDISGWVEERMDQTEIVTMQTSGKCKNVGTQTNSTAEKEAEVIWRDIEEAKDKKTVQEIIDKGWPEEAYRKTRNTNRSIFTTNKDEDLVIAVDAQNTNTNPLIKKLAEKYKHIKTIMDNKLLKPGKIVYTINSNMIVDEEGNQGEVEDKYIFLIGLGGNTREEVFESLYSAIEKLRDTLRKLGRGNIACATPQGKHDIELRKLMEYYLINEPVEVTIYTIKSNNSQEGEREETDDKTVKSAEEKWRVAQHRARRDRNRETIVIRKAEQNKGTYAEMVKELQGKISIEELGIKVRNIRETRNGNIRITAIGGEEARGKFINQVKEKMEGTATAETDEIMKTLFIKDIHETVRTEELEGELRKVIAEVRTREEGIKINLAKTSNKNGVRYAFARMSLMAANYILNKGVIKVGWTECRVEELNTPKRCYKCLSFGHIARECQQAERRDDMCLRCGKTGHTVKNCQNEPACITCRVEGHRADQMACPEYKKCIMEMRKTRTNSQITK